MGRHSIPDPDEPDAESSADHADELDGESPNRGYDDAGQAGRTPYGADAATGDEPGYDAGYAAGYRADPGYDPGHGLADATDWEAPDARDDYGPGYAADLGYGPDAPARTPAHDSDPEPATEVLRTGSGRISGREDGPAHDGSWDGGEWTGSHRAIDTGRRGVSIGVIIALVAVVVVVAGVILWRFFGDVLSERTQAGAARCVAGEVAVAVVADPTIADQIGPLAQQFEKTARPVGDKCVKVAVHSGGSDQVVGGFIGQWPGDLGDRPAVWIPASSLSEARLEAATGPGTVSTSRSLVRSPVVLATSPRLRDALGDRAWSALPALQTGAGSLDALNLPGWGSLKLALPLRDDGDAAYLAAEAVGAAAAVPGAPPTAGSTAISALLGAQPALADPRSGTALDALLAGGDPAAAPVHAVATTEQQVFRRGSGLSDAAGALAAWRPDGPTATADYPVALLSGSWLEPEQLTAASEFDKFLRDKEAMEALAKAGFRAAGATMPTSSVVDFPKLSDPLPVGNANARASVADQVSGPPGAGGGRSGAVTVMLDQTLNLPPVVAALKARTSALPGTDAVGLTSFDGSQGSTLVTLGPLTDPVNGAPRSAAVQSGLDGMASTASGRVSFTTLRNVYGDALTGYRPGQPNSILVITSGPHTDQWLDGPGLLDALKSAADPGRPVAIDVINVGDDPDRDTWQAVAAQTGGQYRSVPASSSPETVTAINDLLG